MAKKKNTGDKHALATVGAPNAVSYTFTDGDGKPMPVRVLIDGDGEPWFVGKDVAVILGYSNPRKAIIDHVDDEDKTDGVTIRDSIGRKQNPIVINESGLYSLILSSKLPTAHDFKHWVTSSVLPSIRKTGMYATPQTMDTMLNDPDAFLRLVQDWHDTKTKAERQAKQLEAQAPKVEAYDDWLDGQDTMLIREAAKTISHTGRRCKESQIRQLLVEWGWAYKSARGFWQPTAYASVEHEWLVLVPCKSHGVKKDGMRFDFPPVMRLTRRGFDRLRARLRDTDSDGACDGLPAGDSLIVTRHGVKHLTLTPSED